MLPQSIVEAEPTETVTLPTFKAPENNPTGALDVPVIVRAPVTVKEALWVQDSVLPLAAVTEPKVTAVLEVAENTPFELFEPIVKLA